MRRKQIYTIGHSTRKIDYFLSILKSHAIEMLVDVRTLPKSAHNPQYNKNALEKILKKEKIHYRHFPELGGLRHSKRDSINTGWHNLSFRGFADYMQTPAFWNALAELEKIATKYKTAIMCAEAVPWRCHRSLIADALSLDRWKVYHLSSRQPGKIHERTPFLQCTKEGTIFYPGA